jgi:glycosyl transferase family 25
MENINCLYINLDYRTDRNTHVINQFNTLNIKAERVDAVKNRYGSIGCSLSHIKCLMIAKKNNWKEVMIVEDDITFLEPNLFKNNLNNFLNSNIYFDVLLIAGNNFKPYDEVNENCIKVYNCQTTTGYIVKQHYYDILINNIKQSVILLMKQPFNHRFYAIDIWWKQLQKKDNWYLLIPLNIIQMTGFSDIEKRMTNYSNVMLKYNK